MKTFIISQTINDQIPALWGEAKAFQKQSLYKIEGTKLPPVNYDSYTLNSHSLTHIEAESHVVDGGKTLDYYFERPEYFYGPVVVVKLKGDGYRQTEKGIRHWEVTREELIVGLKEALGENAFPGKILLSTENYPVTSYGYHDPDYVLTLSQEAADYLLTFDNFNLYGTTWKSSDFKPGLPDRPIHKTLFKKAVILECIDLRAVPKGLYSLNAFPLKIEGASESPVNPVLFQI